jgi:hypothetical protein
MVDKGGAVPKSDVDGTLTEPGSSLMDCKSTGCFYGESCVDVKYNLLMHSDVNHCRIL